MRERLRRAFNRFVDVGGLSHAEAAAAIHADAVDILVDLKGYTHNARTEIVALRPAPVQVSFVGFPATSGAEFIDYLVAGRVVAPPEHAADYSEKLVWIPGSYQVNDRKRTVGETPPRRRLGLPEAGFVFCCFNQTYKILPDVFARWMSLLHAVPQSVLWLLAWNPWAIENLRREAGNHGVAPDRLVFAPLVPNSAHLARIGAADLLLDTLPCNAHTVSSDALWVGLPVITCPGETFASRVAASQLSALGMSELITRSMDEYEALALRLARSPEELGSIRRKLMRNRATGQLFDTPAFTRSLETAFEIMWANHVAGKPAAIAL
jgi:predicted O-linked N-acetylglucosamine transferase (SPINDLY family)